MIRPEPTHAEISRAAATATDGTHKAAQISCRLAGIPVKHAPAVRARHAEIVAIRKGRSAGNVARDGRNLAAGARYLEIPGTEHPARTIGKLSLRGRGERRGIHNLANYLRRASFYHNVVKIGDTLQSIHSDSHSYGRHGPYTAASDTLVVPPALAIRWAVRPIPQTLADGNLVPLDRESVTVPDSGRAVWRETTIRRIIRARHAIEVWFAAECADGTRYHAETIAKAVAGAERRDRLAARPPRTEEERTASATKRALAAKRRAFLRLLAAARMLRAGVVPETLTIRVADSYKAGNCRVGTKAFRDAFGLDVEEMPLRDFLRRVQVDPDAIDFAAIREQARGSSTAALALRAVGVAILRQAC